MPDRDLARLVVDALEAMKAIDIEIIDVSDKSSVTDIMVVASGTSSRHVKSCAEHVVSEYKKRGHMPIGVEGENQSEWVLVDLGDIIVHVFQPETRKFYDIESLWRISPERPADTSARDIADKA